MILNFIFVAISISCACFAYYIAGRRDGTAKAYRELLVAYKEAVERAHTLRQTLALYEDMECINIKVEQEKRKNKQ